MHELGHTLGLDHGGKDAVNHKPNYISVMNYSYQVPHRNLPTNVVGYQFRLDYSREEMSPLIEDELIESLGADGAADDWIIWNESADGLPPHIGVDQANADKIDWNGRNDIESPNPVAADLNRYDVNDDVVSGETLTGSNDWGRVWYHLSGHGNFGYGVSGDPATDPSEWDQDRADAFEALAVTDYTVPEPSAPLMLALGGLALAGARRRRRCTSC
jgi:hypothetical protein